MQYEVLLRFSLQDVQWVTLGIYDGEISKDDQMSIRACQI